MTNPFSIHFYNDWTNPLNSFFNFRFIGFSFDIDSLLGEANFNVALLGACFTVTLVYDRETRDEFYAGLENSVQGICKALDQGDLSGCSVFIPGNEYKEYCEWRDNVKGKSE